jgi:general secretion pathway protein D
MTMHARSALAMRPLLVGAALAATLAGTAAVAQTPPASTVPTIDLRASPPKLNAPAEPAATNAAAGDLVTLNFVAVDLDAVVGAIGQMTNRTFIVDPRVRGQITLATPKPVTREEAYRMLLSVLRLQGFAVVEDGKFAKVVPESDAKLQNGRVDAGAAGARGDQVVTQVFRLNYESAANLVPVLRPLISPNNTISAYDANNTLVITDYADNLRRIGRIIATVDVPGAVDLEIIPLKHATAIDMATLVTRLLDDGRTQGAPAAGQRVTLLADQRTNSLLLRAASRLRAEQAKSLIARLDQPTQGSGNVNIVYLKNAEATKLAQLLRAILSGDSTPIQSTSTPSLASSSSSSSSSSSTTSSSSGSSSLTAGSSTSPTLSASGSSSNGSATTTGAIQADPATNSLIITAPEPVYRNIREIIEKLDMRRAQVFIETLIVEVSAETAAQLGIQWLNLSGLGKSSASVIGGQVFSNGGTSIVSAAQDLSSISDGFNIGLAKGSLTIPGVGTVANLGLLANVLQSDTSANVLSAPNIMTLDNEQATTMVGQNVPFVTGTYTTSSSSSTNPYQTVERKDVGVTLKVKPQVSEGGAVRLQIYQEVSSVADKTLSAGIITNKRSIETNVVVDDGQIIVLGGLVDDETSNSVDKVPVLGDLPVIGALFRSDKRTRTKTNLMVFLRPHVVRDTAASNSVLFDRYDFMRNRGQENAMPEHWLLPNMQLPDLPPLDENRTVKGAAPLIDSAPELMRQHGVSAQPASPAAAKTDATKTDATKTDAAKTDATKTDATKAQQPATAPAAPLDGTSQN